MPERIYKIAGFSIKLIFDCSLGDKIPFVTTGGYKKILEPFRTSHEDKIDFSIRFVDLDFNSESLLKRGNSLYMKFINYDKEKEITTYSAINYYQYEIIIYRVLLSLITKNKNSFLLHASVVNVGNRAFVFIGKSGSGKSTIAKLLRLEYIPLCDDKCLIKKEGKYYYLYQLPFSEKNHYIKNSQKLLVDKFFILKKSDFFKIKQYKIFENKNNIISQFASQIMNKTRIRDIFSLLNRYNNELYCLYFSNKDKSVAIKMREYFSNEDN